GARRGLRVLRIDPHRGERDPPRHPVVAGRTDRPRQPRPRVPALPPPDPRPRVRLPEGCQRVLRPEPAVRTRGEQPSGEAAAGHQGPDDRSTNAVIATDGASLLARVSDDATGRGAATCGAVRSVRG